MKNKALYMNGKLHLAFKEMEIPEPKPDEILLKVEYCGVCGSDVHFYETGCIGTTPIEGDLILGHECAGTVEAVGDQVKNLHPGDRVVLEPGIPCGHCEFCKTGRYNLCPDVQFISCPPYQGAMRNYLTHPAHLAYKLPDEVSSLEGALVEPLCVGMHAAQLGGVQLGDTVVILGAGCIGLTTLAACKARSATKIIVTDLFQNRLDKALEMGADYVVNGREEDTVTRVMELTNGEGANVTFETAGNRVTAAQTESLTKRGGTIVIVGNVMGDTPMNFYKIAHKELVIKTVHRYRNVFPLAVQAIAEKRIDIQKIATNCFAFDDGIQAFETSLKEKQTVVKAILKL